MAWKVYGFMEGRDADKKRGITALYGPLTRKRWIAMPGEKRPRSKKVAMGSTRGLFDKAEQGRKGVEYARWIAARDGKAITDGNTCVMWANVTLPSGKHQSRIKAVSFAGQAGGWLIEIPNWDFIPVEPLLEINDDHFRDLLSVPCEDESLEIAA